MVLVTLHYRLGPLGFLTTEDSAAPGNVGLHDQVGRLWLFVCTQGLSPCSRLKRARGPGQLSYPSRHRAFVHLDLLSLVRSLGLHQTRT